MWVTNVFVYWLAADTYSLRMKYVCIIDMGTWIPVPGSEYYNIAVDLQEGTSVILHHRAEVSFMCLFYGYDDRESLGFPIGMKLQVIDG